MTNGQFSDEKRVPYFTIITICLNAGRLLSPTCSSALCQSFRGIELIVKDGLSTDGSLQTLGCDSRMRILQKADLGIYDAMNQALEVATGKYVLFLNAGDVLVASDVLQKVAAFLTQYGDPDIAYTDYISTLNEVPYISPKRLTRSFLFRNTLCHQATYIKRQLYLTHGIFDSSYRVLADYEFLLRAFSDCNLRNTHIPFVTVKSLHGGFSTQPKNRLVACCEARAIRQRYYGHFEYVCGCVARSITCPALRIWMAGPKSPSWLRRGYQRLVNALQKV